MAKREYNLAVMPGDFIGKEVTAEEIKVLQSEARKYGFVLNETDYPHGGEHYVKTRELLTDATVSELKDQDAIVFGAVGHPDLKNGEVERGILLKLRFDLDQYVNLRPSKLYRGVEAPIKKIHPDLEDGFELTVVREGTGGLYKGLGGVESAEDGHITRAWQIMDYTDNEVKRTCEYAFELAKSKKRNGEPLPITLAFKSNVLEFVSAQLWQPIFEEIARTRYPALRANYCHIDAFNGPWLISSSPKDLGVVVTGNSFGDIVTDLTSSLFGGMGVGSSGCICPRGTSKKNPRGVSMFEPVHGSSPKDYGRGIVSPVAAILSGALMFDNIGEKEAARDIEFAVEKVLASGQIPNLTIHSGVPTQKQTQLILEEIAKTNV